MTNLEQEIMRLLRNEVGEVTYKLIVEKAKGILGMNVDPKTAHRDFEEMRHHRCDFHDAR